jgi:hypothetical protein
MTNDNEPIWGYIETFRKSEYFQEVIGEGYLARWAGIYIGAFLEQSDEEFLDGIREFLVDNTMLGSRTVLPFLENNSVEELRDAIKLFLNENIEPIGFIDKFLELKQCGLFIASHMLSLASEGAYIIYHNTMYEALMKLFPILEGDLEPATDGVSYMYFQMACYVVMESYRFTSVQELHEFLWHGKDTDWKFRKK